MGKVKIIFRSKVGDAEYSDRFFGEENFAGGYGFCYSHDNGDGEVFTEVSYKDGVINVRNGGSYESRYEYMKGEKTSGFISAGMGKENVEIFTQNITYATKNGCVFLRAEYEFVLFGQRTKATFSYMVEPVFETAS